MLTLLLPLAAVTACGEKDPGEHAIQPVRPVKTLLIEAPGGGVVRHFPGRVEAANRATLSFQVGGQLLEILVKEGEAVQTGDLLARLDPTDFKVVVEDRTASFRRAEADFKRAEGLIDKGYVSRSDFDKLEAAYRQADAALNQASNDLAYTELRAPFAGTVSKRLVENFEQVDAKQSVLELRNLKTLEVKFQVPENIVQRIRRVTPIHGGPPAAKRVHATFEGLPGKKFELTFKEAATQADAKTQTFEITMTMPRPEGLNILPGMTANVTVGLFGILDEVGTSYLVPSGAVTADSGLAPRVWVVNPGTMTLRARPVKVGKMRGREIEILEGLEPGDRVVVAGIPHMVEGMKVRLLPTSEQAQPPTDDPS